MTPHPIGVCVGGGDIKKSLFSFHDVRASMTTSLFKTANKFTPPLFLLTPMGRRCLFELVANEEKRKA